MTSTKFSEVWKPADVRWWTRSPIQPAFLKGLWDLPTMTTMTGEKQLLWCIPTNVGITPFQGRNNLPLLSQLRTWKKVTDFQEYNSWELTTSPKPCILHSCGEQTLPQCFQEMHCVYFVYNSKAAAFRTVKTPHAKQWLYSSYSASSAFCGRNLCIDSKQSGIRW